MYRKTFTIMGEDEGPGGPYVVLKAYAEPVGVTFWCPHLDHIDAEWEKVKEFAKWLLERAKESQEDLTNDGLRGILS